MHSRMKFISGDDNLIQVILKTGVIFLINTQINIREAKSLYVLLNFPQFRLKVLKNDPRNILPILVFQVNIKLHLQRPSLRVVTSFLILSMFLLIGLTSVYQIFLLSRIQDKSLYLFYFKQVSTVRRIWSDRLSQSELNFLSTPALCISPIFLIYISFRSSSYNNFVSYSTHYPFDFVYLLVASGALIYGWLGWQEPRLLPNGPSYLSRSYLYSGITLTLRIYWLSLDEEVMLFLFMKSRMFGICFKYQY